MFPSLTKKGDLAKRRDFSPGLSLAFPASRSSGIARSTQGHCRGVGSVGEEGRNPVSVAPGPDHWRRWSVNPPSLGHCWVFLLGVFPEGRGGPGRAGER